MAQQVFVAREQELAQLNGFLDKALAGHGQVCFVTGEAGAGKTALITEFARRAQNEHDDLLVAVGQGSLMGEGLLTEPDSPRSGDLRRSNSACARPGLPNPGQVRRTWQSGGSSGDSSNPGTA